MNGMKISDETLNEMIDLGLVYGMETMQFVSNGKQSLCDCCEEPVTTYYTDSHGAIICENCAKES